MCEYERLTPPQLGDMVLESATVDSTEGVHPYFLIGTRFGTPLFRNAPGNPTGRSKIWNAPVLERPTWKTP